MKDTRRRGWLLGMAAGVAAAGAGAAASAVVRRCRHQRQALALCNCSLTQEAVGSLAIPAQSTRIRAGDLELHAVVAGPQDGPLAVLLHGFPECWYSWRSQIPALVRAGYRVAVPDQRGYNLSDRPRGIRHYNADALAGDIVALIHACGHQQATVIGHDWGGVVAWRLAMDYPEAVDRLVVLNAPHPAAYARALRAGWAQRLRSWYVLFFQIPWLPEALLGLSPETTARLFFRRTAVPREAFSDFDLEVMAAALAQPGALNAMVNWYRAALRHAPARAGQAIEAPALLLWGENDVALDLSLTRRLERWVPNLRVHTIPDCGHWVQNEAPDEVNEQLLGFLGASG